jgi:peptidoglycan L-alanyl-D-glutamate endopeptidase CwlK
MPVDYEDFHPEFSVEVDNLLAACSAAGIEMVPTYAVRTPWEQARIWRQSRSRQQVQEMVASLRNRGADWLAECLESVGPQKDGPKATGSIPGYSWHNWGEAIDCVWVVDKKQEWSTTRLVNGVNGYKLYADIAEKMGLTHGLRRGHENEWDWVHVQLRPISVEKAYTVEAVEREMMVRYGSDPIESL